MFPKLEKEDLSQISLTGARALVLLGLLLNGPKSLEEMRNKLIEYNLMEEYHTNDIIRIDLNTLRAMGYSISRASKSTNKKYVLTDYPLAIKITEEEVGVLKIAYNQIKNNVDIDALLEYDHLLKKIVKYVSDKKTKEMLYGISLFKSANIELFEELIKDCQYNRVINLLYQPPNSKEQREMEISLQQMVIKNNKIYVYGFDINLKEAVALNFKRILKILSKRDSSQIYEVNPVVIKFFIKEFGAAGLSDAEKIIEIRNGGYLIEGRYHNEFLAKQRILSFGSSCTVIEPLEFKEKIIELLKSMRDIYND